MAGGLNGLHGNDLAAIVTGDGDGASGGAGGIHGGGRGIHMAGGLNGLSRDDLAAGAGDGDGAGGGAGGLHSLGSGIDMAGGGDDLLTHDGAAVGADHSDGAGLGAGGIHGGGLAAVGLDQEGGGIGSIAYHGNHVGVPADELVAVILIGGLGGIHAVIVDGHGAVGQLHGGLNTLYDPGDGVVDGGRIDHSAVSAKGILHTRGQQAVGIGRPVITDGQLTVGADIDDAAVQQLDNACAIADLTVNVVVQRTAHIHDTVFQLGQRLIGIDLGRIGHAALLIEVEIALGQQVIGDGDPVVGILDSLAGGAEVVVIAIQIDQAGLAHDHTVFDIVGVVAHMVQAIELLLEDTIGVEDIALIAVALGGEDIDHAGGKIALGVGAVVGILANIHPLADHGRSGPVVAAAGGVGDDLTENEDVIPEGVGTAIDLLHAVYRLAGGIEVVVIRLAGGIEVRAPAGHELAQDGIILAALILEEAGDGALRAAVLIEEVEQLHRGILKAGNTLHTGEGNVIHKVEELGVEIVPALAQLLIQGEGILEGGIGAAEVGALLGGAIDDHIGIVKGDQAIELLVLLVLRKAVQRIGTEIDLVADLALVDDGQLLGLGPGSACLGLGLDAAEDTHGVGGGGIHSLGPVDPLADEGELVILVQLGAVHLEEVIVDGDAGDIHIQVGIELGIYTDLGEHADTLSQLQQEVPGGGTGICTGQHIGQILQLLGDLDGLHIQAEGIGDAHLAFGVIDGIGHIVIGMGIGDHTLPGQGTVAAGDIVEIKGGLVRMEEVQLEEGTQLIAVHGNHGSGDTAQAGLGIADEGIAIEITGRFVHNAHHKVALIAGNGVAVVGGLKGNLGGHTVDGLDHLVNDHTIGHDHMEIQVADDLAICHDLGLGIAVTQSGEDTVPGNGADGGIGHSPGSTLGHGGGIAGIADTLGAEAQGGADGEVLIVRRDDRMVKLRGGLGGGDHHQGGGDRTLVAIGGTVDQGEGIAALLLGNKGGGAAAI